GDGSRGDGGPARSGDRGGLRARVGAGDRAGGRLGAAEAGWNTRSRCADGHRDGRQADGPGEAATRGQADGGRRGLATDERDGSRVCGEREVRPSGAEELQRRGRVHVALPKGPAAPDVFEEFRERIVTVR